MTADDREMRLRGILADLALAAETDDVPLGHAAWKDLAAWCDELGLMKRLHEAFASTPGFGYKLACAITGLTPHDRIVDIETPSDAELRINAERACRIIEGKPSHLVPVPDLPEEEA